MLYHFFNNQCVRESEVDSERLRFPCLINYDMSARCRASKERKNSTGFPCLAIEFIQAKEEIRRFPCLYAPFVRPCMYRRSDRESVLAAESAYVEQSR